MKAVSLESNQCCEATDDGDTTLELWSMTDSHSVLYWSVTGMSNFLLFFVPLIFAFLTVSAVAKCELSKDNISNRIHPQLTSCLQRAIYYKDHKMSATSKKHLIIITNSIDFIRVDRESYLRFQGPLSAQPYNQILYRAIVWHRYKCMI